MKTNPKIALILSTCLLTQSTLAHDTSVHRKITEAAAASAYSSSFGGFINVVSSDDFVFSDAISHLDDGSTWEDQRHDAGGFRPLNHFYDPLDTTFGKGLSDAPGEIRSIMGVNSFFWGSSRDCPGLSGAVNNYSWQNARDNELLGLTAFSRSARQAALSDMFGDLGQVMHLLEDTTSPQHIRNEQHLTFHYFPLPWASPIEEWGMANVGSLNYQQDMLDWYGAGFTKLEDFWDRHLYNGNSSAALNAAESEGGTQLGLAEWCNGNFLGVRHSYAEYYQPHSIQWYPFPSRNHSTDYLQVRSHLDSAVHNLTLKNGYQGHAYYLQKTGDGITSLPDETPFLHHSRFTYFGGRFPYYGMITVDDPNVLNDYHAALIPKAVKYSAGLLDYFFREQIEVGAAVDSGEYTVNVINSSIQPFSGGSFYLFKEDPSGNRSLVQQNDLGGILPAGGHLQFIYDDDSLSGPTRFILVYKGTIGVGGGQPLDPVDANIGIAAQIFTLDPIQGCIDCGGCNFWPCQD